MPLRTMDFVRTFARQIRGLAVASIVGLGLVCAGSVSAATLANYTFLSNSDSSSDSDANSTASAVTAGAGISANFAFNATGNPAPSRGVGADVTLTTEALAITGNDYFTFTLTPSPGFEMDLTSLSLEFDASYNTVDRGYSIRSNVDSYAVTLLSYVEPLNTGSSGTFLSQSLNLTGASFQNLTSAITFRIYTYDNAGSPGSYMRFDNIVLSGDLSAVPEPGSLSLLTAVAGMFGLIWLRRR